jgi:hypothetical protein
MLTIAGALNTSISWNSKKGSQFSGARPKLGLALVAENNKGPFSSAMS